MPGRPFLVVASWGREAVVRPFGFATAGRAYFFFRVAFFATFFLATFFLATRFLGAFFAAFLVAFFLATSRPPN